MRRLLEHEKHAALAFYTLLVNGCMHQSRASFKQVAAVAEPYARTSVSLFQFCSSTGYVSGAVVGASRLGFNLRCREKILRSRSWRLEGGTARLGL